ncbi:MAG: hypothetical protein ATN35_09745 [Epulopiscium sp. Nele67-Bin004]|nr:MAG: hypothetical protein ATN35_09745 [Epulopiscium sp. Nele67-Bin004]
MSKKLVVGLIAALAIGGGTYSYQMNAAKTASQTVTEIVARESTVSIGDIVIGHDESGSVTIPTKDIKYDYDLIITEVLVKEGETVAEGQPLFMVEIDGLDSEIESLENEIESYENQIDNYWDQIDNYQDQIDNYYKQIDTYNKNIESYEKQITTYEKQITTYEKQIASLNSDYADLEDLYDDTVLTQELSSQIALLSYEQTLKTAQTGQLTYSISVTNIDSQLETLEKKWSDLNKQKENYEELISTYDSDQATLALYEMAMNAIEVEIDEKQDEQELYQRENSDYLSSGSGGTSSDTYWTQYESYKSNLSTLKNTLDSAERTYEYAILNYQSNPDSTDRYNAYISAQNAYDTAYTNWKTASDSASTALSNYYETLEEEKLTDFIDEEYYQMSQYISSLQDDYDDAKDAYNDYYSELQSLYGNNDLDDLKDLLEDTLYDMQLNEADQAEWQEQQVIDRVSAENKLESTNLEVQQAEILYERTLKNLQSDVDAVLTKMADNKDDVLDVYDNIDDVKDNIADVYDDIADVRADIADVYDDIADVNADIADVKADISELYADIAEAKAEIEELNAILETSMIVSSYSGIITSINVSEEDEPKSGSTLMSISNGDSNTYVTAYISQDDISIVELGQKVIIELSAISNEEFRGYIDTISYSASASMGGSVNYLVTTKVEGSTEGVYEGMSASLTFIQEESNDVPVISSRAITTERDRTTVKVQDPATGEIVDKEIEIGISDGVNVEVTSGLSAGDIIMIESAVTTMTDADVSSSRDSGTDSGMPDMSSMSMEDMMNMMPSGGTSGGSGPGSSGSGPGNRQ